MRKKIMEEVSQIKKMMGLNEGINLPPNKMDKIDWQETDEVYVKVRGTYMNSSSMEYADYYGYVLQSNLEKGELDPSDIVDINEDFREPDDDYIYNQGDYEGGIKYGPKDDGRHLK